MDVADLRSSLARAERSGKGRTGSARDSFFLALLTLGEGYHNYHHEFQYDYRNGVKPWQMDPTKWLIWMLSKLRLVRDLRRASADKIRSAQRKIGERVGFAPAECSPVA